MNTTKNLWVTSLISLIFLMGCKAQEELSSAIEELPSIDNPTGEQTPPSLKSFSSSTQSSHAFGGGDKKIMRFNAETTQVEFLVPFPILSTIAVSATLPNHPEVSVYTDTAEEALVISFPLSAYLDIVHNPETLPSGRPLPGISGGEPPSFGFPISSSGHKGYGYLAVDYIAVFVESSFNFPLMLQTNITSDQDGSILGTASWLPEDGGDKGGVFISLRLPRELSVLIANSQ